MEAAEAVKLVNRSMIAFDTVLGSAALLAPDATLRVLGHDEPSEDARHLFRRCGPVWLTYAVAHALAATRGAPQDWWAVAWLRGTEIATDVVWAASPAVSRPGSKTALKLAGAFNLALAGAAVAMATRR